MLERRSFWKNKDKLAIWLFLLLKATHNETAGYFEGKEIVLKPGQLLASYQEIADFLEIDKGKVKRAIQSLRDDTRIDTRTDRQQSLITLIDWDIEQGTCDTRNDTAIDTRMTHDRHTVKETENEKEKRSKREKEKEKEINKNERMKEYLYSCQPPDVSCQQEERDFPLTEKDLDKWLDEDDDELDEWDKMQLYYKQLQSGQPSVVSGQELDDDTDTDNSTRPIQQKKKEKENPQSPNPLSPFAAGEHLPQATSFEATPQHHCEAHHLSAGQHHFAEGAKTAFSLSHCVTVQLTHAPKSASRKEPYSTAGEPYPQHGLNHLAQPKAMGG